MIATRRLMVAGVFFLGVLVGSWWMELNNRMWWAVVNMVAAGAQQ